jgi:glycosyltransferase involved in cell wall biosynthesis
MNCSLIICTYNWPEALSLVLSSVVSQSIMPNEIIIADDGSNESTAEIVEGFSNQISTPIIHSWQEDLGCRIPHSRNRAIAKSNFDYIIMIDGDTVLHEDFIKDHKSFAKKGIYLQGSRVLLQEQFTKSLFQKNQFKKPSYFSNDAKNKLNLIHLHYLTLLISFFKSKNIKRIRGCNFSIFREDILKVNGFNEEISTWGREDSEFVQRLFNSGINKQQLKFSGIQYHLFHNERVVNSQKSAAANNEYLEYTINKNLVWCNLGLDRHL